MRTIRTNSFYYITAVDDIYMVQDASHAYTRQSNIFLMNSLFHMSRRDNVKDRHAKFALRRFCFSMKIRTRAFFWFVLLFYCVAMLKNFEKSRIFAWKG